VTLITDRTVSNAAIHLFAALATFARGAGAFRVPRKRLATMIGVRVQDLRRLTQKLVDAQALMVMRIYDPIVRRNKVNGYHLRVTTTAFIKMPASVIGTLSHSEFRCYAAFLKYRDADGVCFPTQRQLAADLHCSVDTVQRSLRKLKAAGLVTVEPRGTTRDRYHVPSLEATKTADRHPPMPQISTHQDRRSAPLSRSTDVDPLKQIHSGADAPVRVVVDHLSVLSDAKEDARFATPMREAPLPSQPGSSSLTREIAPAVDRGTTSLRSTPPPTPAPPRRSLNGRSRVKRRRTTTPRPSRAAASILATLTSLWPDLRMTSMDERVAALLAAERGVEETQRMLHYLRRYERSHEDNLRWNREKFTPLQAIKAPWRWDMLKRIDEAERGAVRAAAYTLAYAALECSPYRLDDFDTFNKAARRHGFKERTPPDWVLEQAAASRPAPISAEIVSTTTAPTTPLTVALSGA
jgi:DNA-binding MarR family transcriptional regulator